MIKRLAAAGFLFGLTIAVAPLAPAPAADCGLAGLLSPWVACRCLGTRRLATPLPPVHAAPVPAVPATPEPVVAPAPHLPPPPTTPVGTGRSAVPPLPTGSCGW